MIKQPTYALISLVLLVVVAGYAIERLMFLKRAEYTTGKVIDVTSYNGRCGGRKSRYSCTKFNASVEFLTGERSRYTFRISAGNARGHNRPLEDAKVVVDDQVPVVYDPRNPSKAYENTTWGVWGNPIMILILQLGSFFTSLSEPRRRKWI
jgi:hypothetical protein